MLSLLPACQQDCFRCLQAGGYRHTAEGTKSHTDEYNTAKRRACVGGHGLHTEMANLFVSPNHWQAFWRLRYFSERREIGNIS